MSTVEPGPSEIPVLPARRRWRVRWRGLLRFVLGLAIVVTLAAGVLRVTSLWGIPDAPEPFDVAAFLAETIPGENNAVVDFDEAQRMLGGERELQLFATMWREPTGFAEEKPETFEWIEAHRPAMEAWRRGTERPDAMPAVRSATAWGVPQRPRRLHSWLRMAGAEAGRLEHDGDLAGAWRHGTGRASARRCSYRARRRSVFTRHFLAEAFGATCRRAADWAAHPKATVPLLRAAIADVEAMAPLHGTEADSLKADYLALMADFDDFADPGRGHPDLATRAANLPRASMTAPSAGTMSPKVARRGLRPLYAGREHSSRPEPGEQQITRMIFANWLAQADKRPSDRPATVSTYPLVFDEDAGPAPSLTLGARRRARRPPISRSRAGASRRRRAGGSSSTTGRRPTPPTACPAPT